MGLGGSNVCSVSWIGVLPSPPAPDVRQSPLWQNIHFPSSRKASIHSNKQTNLKKWPRVICITVNLNPIALHCALTDSDRVLLYCNLRIQYSALDFTFKSRTWVVGSGAPRALVYRAKQGQRRMRFFGGWTDAVWRRRRRHLRNSVLFILNVTHNFVLQYSLILV